MGKRVALEVSTATPVNGVRKRRRVCNDCQDDLTDTKWQENEKNQGDIVQSPKQSSLNVSIEENSPKLVYHLRPNVVNGIVLRDLTNKRWRIGKPIGKGNFGEIFLASDVVSAPVTSENAKYVVKIEPHSNGPLFVEIHCLLNTAKIRDGVVLPPGMPEYIASGSHYFGNARYRFLVLKRFDRDLYSLIKNRRVSQKLVLTLALQIIDVLQHLHDKGYCHNDIKAQNLMISKCTFRKNQLPYYSMQYQNFQSELNQAASIDESSSSETDYTDVDSGHSSTEDNCDDNDYDNIYKTPSGRKPRRKTSVQYSGSNPVRSCRRQQRTSIYDEMVKSHYLRPTKRISYSEFFNEDYSKDDDEYVYGNCKSPNSARQCRSATRSSSFTPKQKNSKRSKSESNSEDSVPSDENIVTEERVFLIDFGLASKFIDRGVHRPFIMDQRRAHDGTLEFTSRDAHMGAHSRRSDLECLGYNLILWSQGFLPWKEAAAQHQNEKVHWVKEYLMKDVKETLTHIYGKQVPNYLGEFLEYVGQLAYQERPDYDKCRHIFQMELISLGHDPSNIQLTTDELVKTSVKIKEEIENTNILEMKNIKGIMKNLNVIMPFHENTISNRVSPKNLRSKSAKKPPRKKFSWTEILSQDPDQIARYRAEKEFDRESTVETPVIRYKGKPTYAIIEIKNRLKLKERLDQYNGEYSTDDETPTANNNKSCSMKKRQSGISDVGMNMYYNNKTASGGPPKSIKTKSGIKALITTPILSNNSTKAGLDHAPHLANSTSVRDKQQRRTRRCLIKTGSTGDFTDESSCSSLNSNNIPINNQPITSNVKRTKTTGSCVGRRRKINRSDRSSSRDRSSHNTTSEDDNFSNYSDNAILFSPKRTRNSTEKLRVKMLNGKDVSANILLNTDGVVGAKRRKRTTPKKRKSSGKDDCSDGDILHVDEKELRAFKKRACRG